MHFASGAFSSATQMAADLCYAAKAPSSGVRAVLVLQRKRNTDEQRLEALRDKGLDLRVVAGWPRLATVWQLYQLCRQLKPDVLVAHGHSEHLSGRLAGFLAGVPTLIQVEHSPAEPYRLWHRWLAKWLAPRTTRFIGVSEGVRRHLVQTGAPEDRTLAIPAGVDLGRFPQAKVREFSSRRACIVMSGRFGSQKDHKTLIRAVAILGQRGLRLPLTLIGGGKDSVRQECEDEVHRLGLQKQVQFQKASQDLPELLMNSAIFVLSTRWEGMPSALVEAMAAGCACVVTDAPGVEGIIENGRTGFVVPMGDPASLAQALEKVISQPGLGTQLGQAARQQALQAHGLDLMRLRYQALLNTL